MSAFKKIFDFYINSSIHVSLAVVSLCLVTGLTLNILITPVILLFVFFSSVTGYNFVKYAAVAGLHHRSLARSLRAIQLFSLACAVGVGITAFLLRWETLVAAVVLGLFTLFYAVPLFMLKKNLRSIAGIKIFVIATVWSGTVVVLPVLEQGLLLYWDSYLLLVQCFLFVIALMIPFEIRDMNYDKRELYTLPQFMGIKKARFLGISLLIVCVVLEYYKDVFLLSSLVVLLMVVVVLSGFILLSQKQQPNYYASVWVEALPILWYALLQFLTP